jgi:hypothetical protein
MTERTERLDHLLKKYVEINDSYKEALNTIQKHKKIQEKIKNIFKEQNIQSYVLKREHYQAHLEFKKIKTSRIDLSTLPEELKNKYKKESIMLKEYFNIIKKH